jgi:hypothetical protein
VEEDRRGAKRWTGRAASVCADLDQRGEKGAPGCAHRSRERRRPASSGCGAADGEGAWGECRWGRGRQVRSAYGRVGAWGTDADLAVGGYVSRARTASVAERGRTVVW